MAARGAMIHPRLSIAKSGYFLDTLTVTRRTGGADTEGNPLDTMVAVSPLTSGHLHELEPKKGEQQEVSEGGRDATYIQALLVVAAGSDIRVGDQVGALGRTYIVRTIDKQRLKVRCWVERIV